MKLLTLFNWYYSLSTLRNLPTVPIDWHWVQLLSCLETVKNHPGSFCCVCDSFITKAQHRPVTAELKIQTGLRLSTGRPGEILGSTCCLSQSVLHDWLRWKAAMPFVNPTQVDSKTKTEHKIVESAVRPVPHEDSLPIPLPSLDRLPSVEGGAENYENPP